MSYPRQSLSSFCCRMLNGMAVNLLGAVRTRCGASINSNKDTKTVSINHSCRHFRMKVRLNLVSLVFNRLCKELTTLSIAPTLSSNKNGTLFLISCSCSLMPSTSPAKLHSVDATALDILARLLSRVAWTGATRCCMVCRRTC